MKKLVALFAAVLLVTNLVAPALAQQQKSPTSTEGPDVGKPDAKSTAGPDVRKKKKKTTSPVPPTSTEGQGVGKTDQK